jgi:hypothetical protein
MVKFLAKFAKNTIIRVAMWKKKCLLALGQANSLYAGLSIPLFFLVAMQQYATWHGVYLTPDSQHYLAASASWSASGEWLRADGKPYVHWSPLYPLLLSLLGSSGKSLGGSQNLLFLLGSIFFWYQTSRKIGLDAPYRVGLVSALCVSVSYLLVGTFLWSEAGFLFFLALWVYSLVDFGYPTPSSSSNKSKPSSAYLLLSVAALLLVMQRNAGIFWVLTALLGLGFAACFAKRQNRIQFVLMGLALVPACLFFASWQYRGFRLSAGNFAAYQHAYFEDWASNVTLYVRHMGAWLTPWYAEGIGWIGIIGLGAYAIWAFFRKKAIALPFGSLLLLCIGYVLGISVLGRIDPADAERLLSPLYPFLCLLLCMLVQTSLYQWGRYKWAVYLLFVLWLAYPAYRSYKNAVFWHSNHPNFTHKTL